MRRDRLAAGEATSQIYSAAETGTTQLKYMTLPGASSPCVTETGYAKK